MFTVILFRHMLLLSHPVLLLSHLDVLCHSVQTHVVKSPCVVKSPWCSPSFCSDTFMLLLSHPVLLLSHPDVHCRSIQTHHPEMTLCGWQDMRIPILTNQITVQTHIHVKNVHVTCYIFPAPMSSSWRVPLHFGYLTASQLFHLCVAGMKLVAHYIPGGECEMTGAVSQIFNRHSFLCAILHNINYYSLAVPCVILTVIRCNPGWYLVGKVQ